MSPMFPEFFSSQNSYSLNSNRKFNQFSPVLNEILLKNSNYFSDWYLDSSRISRQIFTLLEATHIKEYGVIHDNHNKSIHILQKICRFLAPNLVLTPKTKIEEVKNIVQKQNSSTQGKILTYSLYYSGI